jgi:pimeloyl-ACP methyl ester carboxylesterase
MRRTRAVALSIITLSFASTGCGGSPVVRLLEDQSERARLVTLAGEVAIDQPSGAPLVVSVLRVPEHAQASLQIVDYALLAEPGRWSFYVDAGHRYRVIAFEDVDRDQQYDPEERLGAWNGFADVETEAGQTRELRVEITGGVPGPMPAVEMPTGEDRSLRIGDVLALSDPRFGPENGRRGMWEPLAFMREVGGGLFLTEPHRPGRTPVVLVHGMTGYPQEFEEIVAALDAERFEPWLVQYPSGWELEPVADYVARGLVELSQALEVDHVCLVAHSMGGLVSRRALRILTDRAHPDLVRGFVTLASPLGGIPSAAAGARFSPIHVPSWNSLVPDGPFMISQYTQALPERTRYALFFAFDGNGAGDGVVPLTSQLREEAQREAAHVRGFHTTHTGILEDEGALAALRDELERCRSASAPAVTATDPRSADR